MNKRLPEDVEPAVLAALTNYRHRPTDSAFETLITTAEPLIQRVVGYLKAEVQQLPLTSVSDLRQHVVYNLWNLAESDADYDQAARIVARLFFMTRRELREEAETVHIPYGRMDRYYAIVNRLKVETEEEVAAHYETTIEEIDGVLNSYDQWQMTPLSQYAEVAEDLTELQTPSADPEVVTFAKLRTEEMLWRFKLAIKPRDLNVALLLNDDWTIREIASQMGVSFQYVYQLAVKARKKMRPILERYFADELGDYSGKKHRVLGHRRIKPDKDIKMEKPKPKVEKPKVEEPKTYHREFPDEQYYPDFPSNGRNKFQEAHATRTLLAPNVPDLEAIRLSNIIRVLGHDLESLIALPIIVLPLEPDAKTPVLNGTIYSLTEDELVVLVNDKIVATRPGAAGRAFVQYGVARSYANFKVVRDYIEAGYYIDTHNEPEVEPEPEVEVEKETPLSRRQLQPINLSQVARKIKSRVHANYPQAQWSMRYDEALKELVGIKAVLLASAHKTSYPVSVGKIQAINATHVTLTVERHGKIVNKRYKTSAMARIYLRTGDYASDLAFETVINFFNEYVAKWQ